MIKLLAYKYPTVTDVHMQRQNTPIHYSTNTDNVREQIHKLLFEDKFNYLLIKLDKKLFICEAVDDKKYSRREVNYHPHEAMLV